MGCIVAILGGGEEEENKNSVVVYEDSPLSPEVEALREAVLKELKTYKKEEYINLCLAVVMQESHGQGEDVFQCSESLGKPAGTLKKAESIKQGVKLICGYIDHEKVKCKNPQDMDKIKIVLQAYNYSGGYITWINEPANVGKGASNPQDVFDAIGKWTQENALAYQKYKANGKTREGSAAEILGPYAYGDAYYVKHVLRYYQNGSEEMVMNAKAGEAAKVPYEQKRSYLFPGGIYPTNALEMEKYKTTISVPIYDEHGNKTTMNLTVHKKLAAEFKAIFEDMYKEKFPIKSSSTCAYVWKNIIGSGTVSQHSYGAAIDVNWNDNPCFYNTNIDVTNGYLGYQPGKNKYSVTQKVINIWKAHGFYWGGDWSGKKDTMHFSYTEKPG